MRKRLMLILALGAAIALVVAGVAGAYKPTVVKAGNLVLTFNGGITPTKLPKSTPAPIKLNVESTIETTDGTHIPAIKTLTVETDKNGMVNAKGLPTCKKGQLEATTTAAAKKACGPAIVGEGNTEAEIAFPEQRPIPVKSKLLAFNGGVAGNTTTLFVHAYITVPTPAALVTQVKITKIHNGRYGTKSVATIPVIAGGSGSVKSFSLTLGKEFTYKGKKQSYLVAKCPDGHLDAHGTAVFEGGTRASGTIVRPCTPKG